MAVRSSGGLPG